MKELNEENLKNSSKKFHVNDVTAFLGITPRILKHYETTGILSPERADKNGYREYSAEDVIKIQLAERLKKMQLSQKEIGNYFSGSMDIGKKYAELIELKKLLDELIGVLDLDIRNGAPQFSVEDEQSLLCFCKTYPATNDLLQRYLNARDAYSSSISAGCVCDVNHNFFSVDELDSLPRIDADCEQSDNRTYHVCVPVLSAPDCRSERSASAVEGSFQAPPFHLADGTIETVTRKKSLILKFADKTSGNYYKILQDEAKRRGLTLSGKAWVIIETGPHRKTANRTFTFIIGAEIG